MFVTQVVNFKTCECCGTIFCLGKSQALMHWFPLHGSSSPCSCCHWTGHPCGPKFENTSGGGSSKKQVFQLSLPFLEQQLHLSVPLPPRQSAHRGASLKSSSLINDFSLELSCCRITWRHCIAWCCEALPSNTRAACTAFAAFWISPLPSSISWRPAASRDAQPEGVKSFSLRVQLVKLPRLWPPS